MNEHPRSHRQHHRGNPRRMSEPLYRGNPRGTSEQPHRGNSRGTSEPA
jgi:hypothetical protein